VQQKSLVPVNPGLEASPRQKGAPRRRFGIEERVDDVQVQANRAGRQQVLRRLEQPPSTFDQPTMDQEVQEARGETGASQQQVEFGDAINLFGVIDRDK
jgi:hypothetical protein